MVARAEVGHSIEDRAAQLRLALGNAEDAHPVAVALLAASGCPSPDCPSTVAV